MQIQVVFSEKNGVLMLSYENSDPISMAVACAVAEGHSKVCECGMCCS